MEKLLEVKNLHVAFAVEGQSVQAVRNVSFSLNRSEILGIVGESGSGKSVTALAILGLIPHPPGTVSAGSIAFSPTPGSHYRLDTLSEKSLQQLRGKSVSMIFQEPMTSLNPVFTCGTQVLETIRQHTRISRREAKAKVLSLFEEVRLPDPDAAYHAYPHELSGGQKQRVMIAMAISCNPSLVIADEPTTALDVSVQKTILELLLRLQRERKMSLIFISHDLSLVAKLAQRVLVMYQGELVEEGDVDTVFSHPSHPYTQGLIACRPDPDVRYRPLLTIADFMKASPGSSTRQIMQQATVVTEASRKEWHRELYQQEPVLRVEGLIRTFRTKKKLFGKSPPDYVAVNDVAFDLYPGETLGIVGESGCGKTTLARTILQLIPPTEGTIRYKDRDITRLSHADRKALAKEIQIVFQDPYSSLNPRMPVGEALVEPMKVHGLHGTAARRKEKAAELLQQVGLHPDQYTRYPHEFSGGQRQRICIARALAVEPRVIICDESVSALDVSIQAQILNLLNDLKQAFRLTYIFISHDLHVVKYMSDRLIVMKEGKIVEMGDPDNIYTHPASAYTKLLLDAM